MKPVTGGDLKLSKTVPTCCLYTTHAHFSYGQYILLVNFILLCKGTAVGRGIGASTATLQKVHGFFNTQMWLSQLHV